MSQRYFLELSYRGTHYSGWQKQPTAVTIQQQVEQALSRIWKTPIDVVGAGRTDAGVHATMQFAHFDAPSEPDPRLILKLNGILPPDIAAIRLWKPTSDTLHARYSAFRRAYFYRIITQKNPFYPAQAYWLPYLVNWEHMQEATQILTNYTNFASFCKAQGGNLTTDCTIYEARWEQVSETEWKFHIAANRFLRGMVRAIVGTLLAIGRGKIPLEKFSQIIEAQDRTQAAENISPDGLHLCQVLYPKNSLIQVM
ncbi:MAG: tRNA pseudouridine(38-40) synthase TruA [Bacteroidia bacterium]|nr:tRNA pseudouridine(38-40) synthase TruA [Bacteroidia bacterium]